MLKPAPQKSQQKMANLHTLTLTFDSMESRFERWQYKNAMKVADPVVKLCQKCGSERTSIQPRSTLDLVLTLGSKPHKYLCLDCGYTFRAADRRRFKRKP